MPVTSPTETLVRSIVRAANVEIPRMEIHLLLYLAEYGYVFPRGLPRDEFPRLARRFRRSGERIQHAMHDLVVRGAVQEWVPVGEWMLHYSYNPLWRPDPADENEETAK